MLATVRQGIRFASTPAGRVAYSIAGSGPPLLYLLGWVSHLGLMWELPAHRRFVEVLAREYTVIRYDRVGCGMSDRVRDVFTLESELATLDALVEHLGLDRYALLGSCEGGQVAAAHAARHPDAVAALLVYGSCARGADLAPDPVKDSVLSLVRAHWGLGSRVLADIWLPNAPAETVAMFARLQRGAATAEMAAALLNMYYRTRVDDVLPAIRVPTLVLHRRGSRAVRFELGRQMAALIPGAQLVALEGRMQPIYAEWDDAAIETIQSFLREHARVDGEEPTAKPITAREREVATLIATGLTNAEIGRRLGVSVRTVDAHLEHLRNKLGLRTRAQIAVWSVNSGAGMGRSTTPASPARR
jgi:pimeloyl-ACP methyl ester carboxylesterase/DNA-binding CsgD family transcriptional regulator